VLNELGRTRPNEIRLLPLFQALSIQFHPCRGETLPSPFVIPGKRTWISWNAALDMAAFNVAHCILTV
jgi:hypothetical protein